VVFGKDGRGGCFGERILTWTWVDHRGLAGMVQKGDWLRAKFPSTPPEKASRRGACPLFEPCRLAAPPPLQTRSYAQPSEPWCCHDVPCDGKLRIGVVQSSSSVRPVGTDIVIGQVRAFG
jgi:hypothetical protein